MVAVASLVPPASEARSRPLSLVPRFRTLPPDVVAYRSAQLQALLDESFAAKATPAAPVTCCSRCTFPIDPRQRIAITLGGIYHAGCK